MKLILSILLIIVLFSCNYKNKNYDFEKIEISTSDGWNDFYSIKIYPDRRAYFLHEEIHIRSNNTKTFYQGLIEPKQLDSIYQKIKLIQSLKIDTFYDCMCIDCGKSSIFITTKKRLIKTLIDGICYENDTINKMNDLVTYTLAIAKKNQEQNDSIYNFDSRTEQFLPPTPASECKKIKFAIPK